MCFVLFVGANSRSVMVTFAECIDKENDEMKENRFYHVQV